MTEHAHDFGEPADRVVRMCRASGCVEMAAYVDGDWQPLTRRQRTEAGLLMFEDVVMVQAMQVIHGSDLGMAKYLYRTGRGPAA